MIPVEKGDLSKAPFIFFRDFVFFLIFFLKLLPDSSGINDQIEKGYISHDSSFGLSFIQPCNCTTGQHL
ncbi:MAG: hypothetical protein A2V46_14330 [Bacteroidetes bacterium RBG_19FT_COMBO_42_7]|nr:MAG: hypothetical protein A2V46_14330 [Bacteroidetes bacterium RBG_19FT_COMBO_42_7]